MKKTLSLQLMAIFIACSLHAQPPTFYGSFAGTQGMNSSYFGFLAGGLATPASIDNTFVGVQTGLITNSGTQNVAIGSRSLRFNTSGGANSAGGFEALYFNTTGSFNTSNGFLTLHENTKGSNNTATGAYALTGNIDGSGNTATGYFALYVNRNGINNAALGSRSLYNNSAGSHNTASGFESLLNNVTGSSNVGIGVMAAYNNSRGSWNTAVGSNALYNNAIGNFNSAVGFNAGPSSNAFNNTTCLGYNATATGSDQVRLGNSNVTSIGGQVGWSQLSDGRFKKNVKEDVSGLEFIIKLRPVSYEFDKKSVDAFLKIPANGADKAEAKKQSERHTGFIAQEVDALVKKSGFVFNGVEVPQNEVDHYSIRYAEFVVPLVKAVQELASKIKEQEKVSEAQQLEIATLKQKLNAYEENKMETSTGMRTGLMQNSPNPFSTDSEIRMNLSETTQQASVVIYTLEGKEIRNIPVTERGTATVKISGNDLSPGIYVYALIVDGKVVDTKRFALAK